MEGGLWGGWGNEARYGVAGLFRDGQKGDSAIAHRFSALLLGCTGDAEFLQLEIQMFNFQT